jgi:hypothetical protein
VSCSLALGSEARELGNGDFRAKAESRLCDLVACGSEAATSNI